MEPIIIVGSGMAGYGLARELRKRRADLPITLITADDGAGYSKPMLSTALTQHQSAEQLQQNTAETLAAQLGVQIRTHTRVEAIDVEAHALRMGHEQITYGKLVLALGADPVNPGLAGDAAHTVMSVNDLNDYREFRHRLAGSQRITILGGGLIGCEFANDLALAGYEVQMVHPREWPLERLLPALVAHELVQKMTERGVVWHMPRKAVAVWQTATGVQVELDNGERLQTDVVLSAIGLRPRTALAQSAGLSVGRGIQVDRQLHTSDADVCAIGDCAEVAGMVLPFVQPLLTQVRTLGAILAGEVVELSYPAMPVTIKTPIWPLVVAGAAVTAEQDWQIEQVEGGTRARLFDAGGQLQGFALAGAATKERTVLAKALPALLPLNNAP